MPGRRKGQYMKMPGPVGVAIVGAEPRHETDYESKAEKFAESGLPLYSVTLLLMDGTDFLPARVRVEGKPELVQGQAVRTVGLFLNMINRKGDVVQWWTVEGLEPLGPPPTLDGDSSAGRSGKAAA